MQQSQPKLEAAVGGQSQPTAQGTNSNQIAPQGTQTNGQTYAQVPNLQRQNEIPRGGPCGGCMPLRKGCIWIGILNVVLAIPMLAYSIVNLVEQVLDPGGKMFVGLLPLIPSCGFFFVNLGLIIGARDRNQCLCLVWIVMTITFTSLSLLVIVVTLIKSTIISYQMVAILIYNLPEMYFLIVVFYYYKELEMSSRRQGQGQLFTPLEYQPSIPQPMMENSDGVALNARPGQPYPASLATQV